MITALRKEPYGYPFLDIYTAKSQTAVLHFVRGAPQDDSLGALIRRNCLNDHPGNDMPKAGTRIY